MTVVKIEVADGAVIAALNRLIAAGRNPAPALRGIRALLLSQTEANFAAQSGPTGPWPTLAKSTQRSRARRGKWPGMMLQDSGRLAASVDGGSDQAAAWVGTNAAYAAIQHNGGDIERAAYSSWTRLRTDRAGNLLRQEGNANLAVIAKAGHKRAALRRYSVDAYTVHIKPRPYLPATEAGLQAGVPERVLDIVQGYLLGD